MLMLGRARRGWCVDDGGKAQRGFSKIVTTMPTHEGETVKADPAINPNSLLPAQLTYYRYPGSLTTSPCSKPSSGCCLPPPYRSPTRTSPVSPNSSVMNRAPGAEGEPPCRYVRVDGCTKVRFGKRA